LLTRLLPALARPFFVWRACRRFHGTTQSRTGLGGPPGAALESPPCV